MRIPGIRHGVYVALCLHFIRKMLQKLAVSPSVRNGLFHYTPGSPHIVNVTIREYDSVRKAEHTCRYTGILPISRYKSGNEREFMKKLRNNLDRLNDTGWKQVFEYNNIDSAKFSIRPTGNDHEKGRAGDFIVFRAKYGLRVYSKLRIALLNA